MSIAERRLAAIEAIKSASSMEELQAAEATLKELEAHEAAADEKSALLGQLASNHSVTIGGNIMSKTLGQHFIETAFKSIPTDVKTAFAVSCTPFDLKAAAPMGLPSTSVGALSTTITEPVEGYRDLTNVGDLFNNEPITNGNSVTYWVEGSTVEGGFAVVAENATKPLTSWAYTEANATLKKVAGHYKISDEVLEDAPRLAAAIDRRGLYLHSIAEANQYINGNGTSGNMTGVLSTSGIQTQTYTHGGSMSFDTILSALGKVNTSTGLMPDAVLLAPADYYALIGSKDGNGQYLAGGPVFGPYGNGNAAVFAPVTVPFWNVPTYTSSVLTAGTAIVGAFKLGGTVYRKGGVSAAVYNQNEDDAIKNRITVVVESRSVLAVERPAAFVKVVEAAQ